MSASLENKSSLRKLEFPNSTQEALERLFGTFSTLAGSSSISLSMPPKETELILVTFQIGFFSSVKDNVLGKDLQKKLNF
jgi:hypothetical protein